MNQKFINYNANPKGWKHEGDCVVRAVAVATQTTWEDAYDKLYEIGKKKCRMSNSNQTYETYLKQNGFTQMKQIKNDSGRWLKVEELVEKFPNSILVISTSGHLTVAIKGVLIDTWNCGYSKSGRFFIKPIESDEEEGEIIRYLQFIYENRTQVRVRL